MEEALFRVIISLANFLQKLVWLKLTWYLSNTDIAVNILTLIKLKVEAELHFCQRQCKTLDLQHKIKY